MKNDVIREREWFETKIGQLLAKATVEQLKNVYYMLTNIIKQ